MVVVDETKENLIARSKTLCVFSSWSSSPKPPKKVKMTKLSILALSGHIMADERFYVNVDRIDRRAIQEFRDFLDREVFCEGNKNTIFDIFSNVLIRLWVGSV